MTRTVTSTAMVPDPVPRPRMAEPAFLRGETAQTWVSTPLRMRILTHDLIHSRTPTYRTPVTVAASVVLALVIAPALRLSGHHLCTLHVPAIEESPIRIQCTVIIITKRTTASSTPRVTPRATPRADIMIPVMVTIQLASETMRTRFHLHLRTRVCRREHRTVVFVVPPTILRCIDHRHLA